VRQRALARSIGFSLGMTNAIVKRLAKKGWITVRRVNSRNIQYAVSRSGLDEISRRSIRYVKRTIRYVVMYKEALAGLAKDVRRTGYRGILLAGRSDIDFIVEHVCSAQGLGFTRGDAADVRDGYFVLFSEDFGKDIRHEGDRLGTGSAFLKDMMIALRGAEAEGEGVRI
jgi:DNA-binding PadR family transcriptional regulator